MRFRSWIVTVATAAVLVAGLTMRALGAQPAPETPTPTATATSTPATVQPTPTLTAPDQSPTHRRRRPGPLSKPPPRRHRRGRCPRPNHRRRPSPRRAKVLRPRLRSAARRRRRCNGRRTLPQSKSRTSHRQPGCSRSRRCCSPGWRSGLSNAPEGARRARRARPGDIDTGTRAAATGFCDCDRDCAGCGSHGPVTGGAGRGHDRLRLHGQPGAGHAASDPPGPRRCRTVRSSSSRPRCSSPCRVRQRLIRPLRRRACPLFGSTRWTPSPDSSQPPKRVRSPRPQAAAALARARRPAAPVRPRCPHARLRVAEHRIGADPSGQCDRCGRRRGSRRPCRRRTASCRRMGTDYPGRASGAQRPPGGHLGVPARPARTRTSGWWLR